jgi:uncharacterized lipoprotein YddW (UPF0748 family)
LLTLTFATTFAQSPKREMRATWVATVGHIDWPKTSGAALQQAELTRMLDSMKTMNMNVVFFQVRSRCDAMYNSAYEPWSSDLYVSRGTNPGYDPLAFAIQECHKRGIECHAWLNPYRYNNSGSRWTGSNDHPLNYEHTHPDWLIYYSNNIILDPGIPDVRFRVKSVVGDILSKYEVDGILFDDYFYAYGGTTTQDAASQATYKPTSMNVHDWRRDNVNRMVADVYDTIQAVKPWVTFGVSPFGIWTTTASVAAAEGLTLPAGITGGNMYQEIYCDPVAWLKAGTVDYISPQLYWKTGGAQDYATLCPWWANLASRFGKYFFSSMANYKYAEKTDAAYTVSELSRQSTTNRQVAKDGAPGHVFYNTLAWIYDKPFRTEFKANQFVNPALPPAISWKPAEEQSLVSFNPPSGSTISWTYNTGDNVRFVVYAVPNANRNDPAVFSNSKYILGISYATQYPLPLGVSTSSHRIAVSVLDHYGNEYPPRILGAALADVTAAQLTYPADYAVINLPVTTVFQWQGDTGADSYIWQLARNAQFTDITASRETIGTEFNAALQSNIRNGGIYYWRVKTRKANATSVWSETRRVNIGGVSGLDDLKPSSFEANLYNGFDNVPYLFIQAAQSTAVTISIYNLSGQLLSVENRILQQGDNSLTLNQKGITRGIYLVRIKTETDEMTLKMRK